MSISGMVQEVLRDHPELAWYEEAVEVARGRRADGGTWGNPQLSLEVGYREFEEKDGDGIIYGARVLQPFEFPGKGALRKAVLDRDIFRADLALQQFRRALDGKTRQWARRYQLARRKAEALRMVSERSESIVRLLQSRPQQGARPLIELRILEASQIELHEKAKHAAFDYHEAQFEINALLGRHPDTPVELSDRLLPPDVEAFDREKLSVLAQQNNLNLKLLETDIEKAGLSLDSAQLEALPDFALGPFFSREEGTEQEWSAGLQLTLDLPLWNQGRGKVAGARAVGEMARYRLALARVEVDRQVFERALHYELTLAHYREVNEEVVEKMAAAAALADRQYRQGAIDARLYLESQQAYLKTLEIYTETLQQLWDAALDIELLTGGTLKIKPSGKFAHEKN